MSQGDPGGESPERWDSAEKDRVDMAWFCHDMGVGGSMALKCWVSPA